MAGDKLRYQDPWCSFEGMTWPMPGKRLVAIERTCRGYDSSGHDSPLTMGDRMVIASVISAYNYLVLGPTRSRAHKLSMIRKAVQMGSET